MNDPKTFWEILVETGNKLLTGAQETLPSVIGAIVVFIIGWIIAKFISGIIRKVLVSIKIDSVADKLNEIDIVSQSNVKFVPSKVLSKIMYYVVILVTLIASTNVLGMPEVSQMVSNIINYVPKLLSALILLAVGLIVADFIKGMVLSTLTGLGIPSAKLIATFVFYFIFITILISALAQAGINTDLINNNLSMILGGGVLAFALGYGFAAKDMMANYLASFYTKEKFTIGDNITVEEVSGNIVDMDNSSLTLQSDSKKVIIPLSKITAEKVTVHEK